MPQIYTTASWTPFPGHEEAFLAAWQEFMGWATSLPGAGEAVLSRDLRDPERFISFAAWDSVAAMRSWKDSPEFKPRMGRVQEHIDRFVPTEVDVVARVGAPPAVTVPAAA